MTILTDEEIEKCREKAAASYKHHRSSIRGQQVTEADDPEMHLIWAVIAAYEAKLREQGRLIPEKTHIDKHDIEHLKTVFSYDPENGEVSWKSNRGNMTAGAEAGSIWRDGYRYIRFNGAVYLAHRLAFALHHGFFPEAIDHINTVKNDNRISNLRQATVAENNRNRQKQANNSTGYKGVSFNKKTNKFQARITSDGTHHSLGYFSTLEEAASAYAKAAGDLHGEFARFEHPAPIPEGWISVGDRLPETDEEVLVFPPPSDYCITASYGYVAKAGHQKAWGWVEYETGYGHVNHKSQPTHWMPLPQPPMAAARSGE